MPAVAIGAAALSVSAGIAAGGVIGGIMIAGGVMSGLGAVTGNKDMSQLGGLMSLAGGTAGLMSGSWADAANEVAMNSAVEGTGTTSADWAAMDAANNAALQGVSDSAAPMQSFAQQAAETPVATAADQVTSAPSVTGVDASAATPGAAPESPTAGGSQASGSPSAAGSDAPTQATDTAANTQQNMSNIWAKAKSAGTGLIDSVSTGLDKFGTWAGNAANSKAGQAAMLGAVQGGAGAVLQSRAQQLAWQRQQDALAQQRGLINTSISGQRV